MPGLARPLQVELLDTADEVKAKSLHSLTRVEAPAVTVGVAAADGVKCERCWHYHEDLFSSDKYPGVCPRCADALLQMEFPAVDVSEVYTEAPPAQVVGNCA